MPGTVIAQAVVLLLASGSFFVAFALALKHLRTRPGEESEAGGLTPERVAVLGPGARGAIVVGTVLAAALLIWRLASAGRVSLDNHLDVFLLLGLMLTGMLVYLRLTKSLRLLSFFLPPMVGLLLLLGGALTLMGPGQYNYASAWARLHVSTIILGVVCFAAGCAGGVAYLLNDRQLRKKEGVRHAWLKLPPLTALERFTQRMVLLGFGLLTVSIIAGVVEAVQHPDVTVASWLFSPKVVLAAITWVVYAVVLHVRFAPSFRGRRAAWLSVIGFCLLVGVFLALHEFPKV